MPGATIIATETRTNISRTAVSNAAGNYTFTNLSPGSYRVEGELVGFRKFSRDNVEVNVNTTIRVDIALTVGELEESVTVTGEAPMLQTDRTDTGRIIQSEQITQLPLAFNRNFQGALAIVPGASRPFRPHSEFYNSQDSLSSNVNGQERQSNNVQLEGTDNSDNGGNLAFMIPSAEAIETVGVTTSNYDAEFGRAGGAVTNVTLKSGTNDLRGSLFTFGNTEATMARNPFTSLPPTDTTYVQAGFTLGGPIKRNKLFFFGDYVRTQRRQRASDASPRAGGGVPHRRLQFGADDHLRSGDRRRRRRGANAVPEQSNPCQSHQPRRAAAASTRSRCRTFPARRLARSITKARTCVRSARTSSTSSSPIRWRRTTTCRSATATRMPRR